MGVWKLMSGMALRSCAVTTLDLRGRPGQRDREGRIVLCRGRQRAT